jgi:hypothetical protein
MQFLFECLGTGSLHYLQCSNWITTMQRQLQDSKNKARKKCHWKFCTKNLRKISSLVWYRNSAQGQTNRPPERIPVTHATLVGKSQFSHRVRAEKSKRRTGKTAKKCTKMYCRKCDTGLWTLYRAVFWSISLKTELMGVKVTTEFHRQCHKTLILHNV